MNEDIINKVEGEVKKLGWPRFASFFEETENELSMTRLVTFAVIFIPLILWSIISLIHWSLAEMPSSIIALQAAGLTGKAIAKSQEK